MIEIKTKDNEQDYRYVRIEVFMKEQGFQNEFDEIDATAVHITVYVDGTLAGCARCFPKEEEAAWVFGRIAVLPQFRHHLRAHKFMDHHHKEQRWHQQNQRRNRRDLIVTRHAGVIEQ